MVALIAMGGAKTMIFQFRVWLEEKLGLSMFWWKFVCWIIFGMGIILMLAAIANFLHFMPGTHVFTTQDAIVLAVSAAVFWLGFFLADGSYTEAVHGF